MKIALASDHAGYEQLKELQIYLESLGHECLNFGPKTFDPNDDYPIYIAEAAKAVAGGQAERGVILGGSGEGEAMAANRHKGVRCTVFYGPAVPRRLVGAEHHKSHDPYEIIKLSREHNDANMLSLAGWFVALADMKHVIKLWLETDFSKDERHERRNQELDGVA